MSPKQGACIRHRRLHSTALTLVLLAGVTHHARGAEETARGPTRWNCLPVVKLRELPGELPTDPTLLKSIEDAIQVLGERESSRGPGESPRDRAVVELAVRRSLGLDPFPERNPLQARTTARNDFEGYSVENLIFESRPGYPVTANLYRPREPGPGKRPAVLSPIGHFLTPGKTAGEVQARCIQLARLGFIVLAYDAAGQGERLFPGNNHHDAGYALLSLGETIAGWMVWDSIRALDYLLGLEEVDPERIGITGNSGGGLNSLLTAALDHRVKCAVVAGFTFEFRNWIRYGGAHCTCTHFPGAFRSFSWAEIAGLIAPRPLLLLQGEDDQIFPIGGARASAAETARLYATLGQTEHFRVTELGGQPHAYSRPFREAMYGWMLLFLGRKENGAAFSEDALEVLPEVDRRLLCDPTGTVLPGAPTIVDLARQAARTTLKARSQAPLAPDAAALRAWIEELASPPTPGPTALLERTVQRIESPGGNVEKLHFHSEDGQILPAVLWLPPAGKPPSRAIVLVSDRGKAAVLESELVPALVAAGNAVLALDLRGRGETLGRHNERYTTGFRLVANQVLLGRPLAGRRAFDLRRAADLLGRRRDTSSLPLTLVGLGEDALPALLASVVDPRFEQIVLAGWVQSLLSLLNARAPAPAGQRGATWNDPQLDGRLETPDGPVDFGTAVPSLLARTDVAGLVALLQPRRVLLCEARDAVATNDPGLEGRGGGTSQMPGVEWLPREKLTAALLLRWLR